MHTLIELLIAGCRGTLSVDAALVMLRAAAGNALSRIRDRHRTTHRYSKDRHDERCRFEASQQTETGTAGADLSETRDLWHLWHNGAPPLELLVYSAIMPSLA